MRPFWIHQLAEYLIGIALVAQGLQEQDALVPATAGTLVVLNVAVTRGPLGAFKWIGRRAHRWLDLVVMAAVAFGALQPWAAVGSGGRVIMLLMLVPLGFLWFYTDWAERRERRERRAERAVTGDAVGRSAGRLAGNAYLAGRRAVRKRSASASPSAEEAEEA